MATLYQKVEMFYIFGPHSQSPVAIEVKFCTAKRTHVPVARAKFNLNRCNESPLRGEQPDFWPVNKYNTGSLPLRGNPAGNKSISSKAMQYHRVFPHERPLQDVVNN